MIQMLSSLLFCPPSLPQFTSLEPGTTRPTILPFLSSPLLSLSFPSLILSSFDFIYIYISVFFLPSFHFHETERREKERESFGLTRAAFSTGFFPRLTQHSGDDGIKGSSIIRPPNHSTLRLENPRILFFSPLFFFFFLLLPLSNLSLPLALPSSLPPLHCLFYPPVSSIPTISSFLSYVYNVPRIFPRRSPRPLSSFGSSRIPFTPTFPFWIHCKQTHERKREESKVF